MWSNPSYPSFHSSSMASDANSPVPAHEEELIIAPSEIDIQKSSPLGGTRGGSVFKAIRSHALVAVKVLAAEVQQEVRLAFLDTLSRLISVGSRRPVWRVEKAAPSECARCLWGLASGSGSPIHGD